MRKLSNLLKFLMIMLALSISIYALKYMTFETAGLLNDKDPSLLVNNFWLTAFYIHVFFGLVSLALGGFQFIKIFRDKYLKLHRKLGIVYVYSVFLSGIAGLFLAFFANGGWIASLGFSGLSLCWLITNYYAFIFIKKGDIDKHQDWMIRNYAVTLAAVTLRIWIPILMIFFSLQFIEAYRLVAWLCWVPNLVVAEAIVRNLRKKPTVRKMQVA